MPIRYSKARMGVNLIVLRNLSGSSRSSGPPVRPPRSSRHWGSPSGSSGRPGRRSTPPRRDLIVNTYKHRGQSARMHKTTQIRSKHTAKPTLTGRS